MTRRYWLFFISLAVFSAALISLVVVFRVDRDIETLLWGPEIETSRMEPVREISVDRIERVPVHAYDVLEREEESADDHLSIWGTVMDLTGGRAVEGVEITAHGVGISMPCKAASDDDGKFILRDLERTVYLLEVSKEGFGTQIRDGVVPGAGSVDFTLECPGRLVGRVVDSHTGAPVNRFDVELIPQDFQMRGGRLAALPIETAFQWSYYKKYRRFERWYGFESKDGTFEIPGLPKGRYYVLAGSEPYGITCLLDPVEILPCLESSVEIPLTSSRVIRGRVLDADRLEPVQGARVQPVYPVLTEQGDPLLARRAVFTDWAGRFEARSVLKASTNIEITHPAFSARSFTLLFEGDGISVAGAGNDGVTLHGEELKIYLSKGMDTGAIKGTVGGALFKDPVPPMIGVQGRNGFFEVQPARDDGTFYIAGLNPGRYTVFLTSGGEIVEGREANVEHGKETELAFDTKSAEGACIRGMVYAGLELYQGPGFVVLEGSEGGIRRISPLKNGSYNIQGLPPGSGQLNVWPHSGMGSDFKYRREVTWGGGVEMVDLNLPGTELFIRILDESGRSGLKSAVFKLCRNPSFGRIADLDFRGALLQAVRDDGRAVLKGLPPGKYTIGVFAEGYARYEGSLEVLEAGRSKFTARMKPEG